MGKKKKKLMYYFFMEELIVYNGILGDISGVMENCFWGIWCSWEGNLC